MKNLYYIKKGLFGTKFFSLGNNESVRNTIRENRIPCDVKVKVMTDWPVSLKAVGYKGNYEDGKMEVLKLIPPSLVDKAFGFSVKLDNEADLLFLPNEVDATVTLYE